MSRIALTILILSFLAINLATRHSGWTNPASRYAFMCALVGRGTFNIDGVEKVTVDWARTPDGRYYSNKAPGAGFAGAPIFWLIQIYDQWKTGAQDPFELCKNASITARLTLISLILQVFGAIAIMFYGLHFLRNRSPKAQGVFAVSYLFCSTASCFMNTYFGHALAANFLLAALLTGLNRRFLLTSFFWGWALLTDYGVLWTLPGFVLLWLSEMKRLQFGEIKRSLLFFGIGTIIPATLWIWYHTSAFGNAWTLPNKFQNPEFVDQNSSFAIWGILNFFPSPKYLFELLFGTTRGILWTQPWVLVLVVLGLFQKRFRSEAHTKLVAIVCVTGLFGLLFMNASFNGWHGGLSPGPRYLSPIFPLFSLWLGFVWDNFGKNLKRLMYGLLAFSALFTVLAMCHGIVMREESLWPQFFEF